MVVNQALKILKRFYHQPPKKYRKSKQTNVISEQENSDTSKSTETDDNPVLSVIQEKYGNICLSLKIWLVIQVIMTSCHRNFRKTVYADFCDILQFGKKQNELRKSDLATLVCSTLLLHIYYASLHCK